MAVTSGAKFARRVFLGAGIYGVLVLLPQYFIEVGLPAPIARPEHFYGFIGVALAWQFAFFLTARDVERHRPLMLAAVAEKVSFGLPVILLFAASRVSADVLVFALIDLTLGVLFVLAYLATGPSPAVT